MAVRTAKTQISQGIRPVWSESSLSAWRKLGSLPTHWAHSQDSDQTGRIPSYIWAFAGRTLTLLVLSRGGSVLISHFCVFAKTYMRTWIKWNKHLDIMFTLKFCSRGRHWNTYRLTSFSKHSSKKEQNLSGVRALRYIFSRYCHKVCICDNPSSRSDYYFSKDHFGVRYVFDMVLLSFIIHTDVSFQRIYLTT